MSDVTQILIEIDQGDPTAVDRLLPLVYDELRRLATARIRHERVDQTLQATALVHEAYLRLVKVEDPARWESRSHFFAAAATAMRRILVNRARDKRRLKRGGEFQRLDCEVDALVTACRSADLLELDEAVERLQAEAPDSARVVEMRFFAGWTLEEIADLLGCSRRTVDRHWQFARAWLFRELS